MGNRSVGLLGKSAQLLHTTRNGDMIESNLSGPGRRSF